MGFCLAFAWVAAGQTDHGTITGTVPTRRRQSFPTRRSSPTIPRPAPFIRPLTTATGNFTVPSLPAGNYDVTVEAPGFRKYIGQNLRVQVAQVTAPGCDARSRRDHGIDHGGGHSAATEIGERGAKHQCQRGPDQFTCR